MVIIEFYAHNWFIPDLVASTVETVKSLIGNFINKNDNILKILSKRYTLAFNI